MERGERGILFSIFLGVGLLLNYLVIKFSTNSNNILPSIYILNIVYIVGFILGSLCFNRKNTMINGTLTCKGDSCKEYVDEIIQYNNLTNLPNRLALEKYIDIKFIQGKGKENMEVLFLDIDGFKVVNDTMGHMAGDEILKDISIRMKSILDSRGKIFHIRGDEFFILIDNKDQINNREDIAMDIINCMEKPFQYEKREFHLTTSIGIASYPEDGHNVTRLLKSGNLAMKDAKESGKNKFMIYDSIMDFEMEKKLELINQLYRALENNEFTLNYQPQVNSAKKEIIGLEALIRWENPVLGFVSPADFIPIAEETSLILQIGEWVLRTACRQNKLWQEKGYESTPISVNISGVEFQHPTFINKLEDILKETGLDPQWLHLEITESVVIDDGNLAIEVLEKLKNMGVQTALDDFGTGFSSLGYLNKFKINILKIDSSFINAINEEEYTITEAIIALGKNLKMEVIAEGVETVEQRDFLSNAGCHNIQGYLYSKPLSVSQIEEQFHRAE